MIGTVLRYNLARGFGFVDFEGRSHLFQASHFQRLVPGGPPPVPGEKVRLSLRDGRVYLAAREEEPRELRGEVVSYERERGFIRPDGWHDDLYFHVGDLGGAWTPWSGTRVRFYVGYLEGARDRPRAYWVAEVRRGDRYGT